MDFDLVPDIETPEEIINRYFPNKTLFLPYDEFWSYIKNHISEFPYFLVSILNDLYNYEKSQDISEIGLGFKELIISFRRNTYIDSALQANYRFSMEIAYGMKYDEVNRKNFKELFSK